MSLSPSYPQHVTLILTREPQIELPLQNSFARLLAHKLADYYNLLHIVGSDNNSVVLYRNTQHKL